MPRINSKCLNAIRTLVTNIGIGFPCACSAYNVLTHAFDIDIEISNTGEVTYTGASLTVPGGELQGQTIYRGKTWDNPSNFRQHVIHHNTATYKYIKLANDTKTLADRGVAP
ncbi:hypothetical protein [Acidithiobacillus sulfuriphilus]|uniref:Uncharacterized protein n=1 Tax=Acidithiobacillus sulfuriphilus TaxID=1867749 RepID=A0ACD5HN16_9PROT|nr:hypothetical protein [Acidithiobacillus sulfuriphilus]